MVFLLKLIHSGLRYKSGYGVMSFLKYKPFKECMNVRVFSIQQQPLGIPKKPNEESFDAFRVREEKKEEDFANSNSSQTESSHSTTDSHEKKDESLDIKIKILDASLTFVPKHGWSKASLSHGAEQIGFPSISHGMFSRGGIEIVEYFNGKCNKELIDYMKKMSSEKEFETPTKFVSKAVEVRLRMIEPHKENWSQALALMSLPPNVPISLSNLLTMVDDICYYAGDRSVDFNWYTRRIGLASIYKATEFFMLQDKSPDHAKTWTFLEHRIADASKMQDFLKHSEELSKGIQQTGKSIFDTARNILGMGFNRR